MVTERGETLSEELARLLLAHDGASTERYKTEAWNLIADFAVQNGDTIVAALAAEEECRKMLRGFTAEDIARMEAEAAARARQSSAYAATTEGE